MSSTKKTCGLCHGTKKSSDMGFIEKTCTRCGGLGYEDNSPIGEGVANLLSKAEKKLDGEASGIIEAKKEENTKPSRGRPRKEA